MAVSQWRSSMLLPLLIRGARGANGEHLGKRAGGGRGKSGSRKLKEKAMNEEKKSLASGGRTLFNPIQVQVRRSLETIGKSKSLKKRKNGRRKEGPHRGEVKVDNLERVNY